MTTRAYAVVVCDDCGHANETPLGDSTDGVSFPLPVPLGWSRVDGRDSCATCTTTGRPLADPAPLYGDHDDVTESGQAGVVEALMVAFVACMLGLGFALFAVSSLFGQVQGLVTP